MDNILSVKNISFGYEDELVFQDVNVEVERGDFLAFVGPNGSGKSTLMKIMIGNIPPDKGEVYLFGKGIRSFKDWSKVGYMSQNVREFNQSFPATVREVIAANLYHQMGFIKLLTKNLEERINRVLKLVNMEGFQERQIGNLSGGQKQRVFIARTLVTEPELIFLDEPMVGIDAGSQDEFIKLINRLNRDLKITILMVSHDIHIISSQANKIACFGNKNIYLHQSDDFDYDCYVSDTLSGESDSGSRILPEHSHYINSNEAGSDDNA